MRVVLNEQTIEIRLARWQKLLGLMRDIRIERRDISDVRILEQPVRAAMGAGIKVGLRLPWLYFVARTIKLDQVFIVTRRVPALSFGVENNGPLRRVTVSTHEAAELAQCLSG